MHRYSISQAYTPLIIKNNESAPQQRRRFSLADRNLAIARIRRNSLLPALHKTHTTTLTDLPTEVLEQIFGYCCGSIQNTVNITRKPDSPDFLPADLVDGSIRRKWTSADYPLALLLTNRRIHDITFSLVWRETAFILSVSATDALCFLKYALSERQRAALRRIRFTRFMLSWEDGVGDDIWLSERKRAPAFLAGLVDRVANTSQSQSQSQAVDVARASRMNGLVEYLQSTTRAVPLPSVVF